MIDIAEEMYDIDIEKNLVPNRYLVRLHKELKKSGKEEQIREDYPEMVYKFWSKKLNKAVYMYNYEKSHAP